MGASMRGSDATSGSLFSYVDLEQRVPAAHPLRTIRTIVNDVLGSLDAEFERLYEGTGRQSIAPERLLKRRQCGKRQIFRRLPECRRLARCFPLDMGPPSAAGSIQSSETISGRHEPDSATQD